MEYPTITVIWLHIRAFVLLIVPLTLFSIELSVTQEGETTVARVGLTALAGIVSAFITERSEPFRWYLVALICSIIVLTMGLLFLCIIFCLTCCAKRKRLPTALKKSWPYLTWLILMTSVTWPVHIYGLHKFHTHENFPEVRYFRTMDVFLFLRRWHLVSTIVIPLFHFAIGLYYGRKYYKADSKRDSSSNNSAIPLYNV